MDLLSVPVGPVAVWSTKTERCPLTGETPVLACLGLCERAALTSEYLLQGACKVTRHSGGLLHDTSGMGDASWGTAGISSLPPVLSRPPRTAGV